MKFRIAAVGKIKEDWLKAGIAEYVKRLTPTASVEIVDFPENKMPERPSEAVKQSVLTEEGEKLLRTTCADDYVILLDLKGKELSSESLSALLEKEMVAGHSRFTFLIGGPFGNGENLRRRADFCLKLSDMTFTHQMARLILTEQLYRAMKIMKHEPYHL